MNKFSWYGFKYEVGGWLRKRLFPPSQRTEWDLDDMVKQWEEEERWQRQNYPVRFHIEKAWEFVSRWPRTEHALYWLRTHTYNRYHILDLSKAEPENPDGYRWGWIDRDRLLLLACFKVLRDFVEQEKPWPVADYLAEVEAKGNGEVEGLRRQQANYEETMALYRWWTEWRFAEYAEWESQRDAAYEAYKKEPESEALRQAWLDLEEKEHTRDDEMLRRLLAIRHYLWT